eukprot:358045-Chlamydomonas_euryale.AAC.3
MAAEWRCGCVGPLHAIEGVIPLEALGHVGQPGKVWTWQTRGAISQSSPPLLWCVRNATLARLAAAAEFAGGQLPRNTKTRQCLWIAPTRRQRANHRSRMDGWVVWESVDGSLMGC